MAWEKRFAGPRRQAPHPLCTLAQVGGKVESTYTDPILLQCEGRKRISDDGVRPHSRCWLPSGGSHCGRPQLRKPVTHTRRKKNPTPNTQHVRLDNKNPAREGHTGVQPRQQVGITARQPRAIAAAQRARRTVQSTNSAHHRYSRHVPGLVYTCGIFGFVRTS